MNELCIIVLSTPLQKLYVLNDLITGTFIHLQKIGAKIRSPWGDLLSKKGNLGDFHTFLAFKCDIICNRKQGRFYFLNYYYFPFTLK